MEILFRSGCHWLLTGFGLVDLFRAKELKRDRWSRLCASTEAECGTLETGDHPSSPQQGVGDERTTQAPGRRVTFVYAGKGHSHVLTICLCLMRTGIFAHKGQNQRRAHNTLRTTSCMCEFFLYDKWCVVTAFLFPQFNICKKKKFGADSSLTFICPLKANTYYTHWFSRTWFGQTGQQWPALT